MIRGFLLPEKLFSLKRASTKCDRANGSVLEADCAAADFTESAPFEEETAQERRCFLSLWVALKTGTWKKYTKTEGSWQCFVRAGNDKQEKKKASKPGGSGGNAKKKKNLRIIRKEIYCTYSKAVTPCLLQGSNAVLIKEVNHFTELWHAVWLPSPKCQSRW